MFLIIGTTTLDIFVSGFDTLPEIEGDEFTSSSLVFCEHPIQMGIGGNGANSAYVLARLGVPVNLHSAIGADPHGEMLSRWLIDGGVDISGLIESTTAGTSATTILTDENQDRLSFHHHGASALIQPDALPKSFIRDTGFLLFSGYPLLTGWNAGQLEILMKNASNAGTVTCMDIGPLVGDPIHIESLSAVFPYLSYFLCNEFELLSFTRKDTIKDALSRCFHFGASTVILKRGTAGAQIAKSDGQQPTTIPAFETEPNSTVGAGDSFNSGFLYGISRGWDEERSAQFGNAVAALVLSSGEGVLGAPALNEVQNFLHTNTRK
jgi:sugar/nucleoside kinase (ribokinase family)